MSELPASLASSSPRRSDLAVTGASSCLRATAMDAAPERGKPPILIGGAAGTPQPPLASEMAVNPTQVVVIALV